MVRSNGVGAVLLHGTSGAEGSMGTGAEASAETGGAVVASEVGTELWQKNARMSCEGGAR